jgi:spermidine synthase
MTRKVYDVMEIPNGKSGPWEVSEFEITEEGASLHNIRCYFQVGMGRRTVVPGVYKKLTVNKHLVMSNTRAEISDHAYFVWEARGDVLVNGLGLGVVLSMLLNKDSIESATVIEIAGDVISLVAPYFQEDSRVQIIHDDALTWKPPKNTRYNAVWHDIWDSISADNLSQMHKLHRRYGRRTDWQGSWCRGLCELYA